jgi:GAF domain-containing protein
MLAVELANRLAVTADSARLFDQSVRAAEREALINEISGKLTQQTEVSQILQVAVKELGQALRVPQTSIRLTRAKSASQLSQQGERNK